MQKTPLSAILIALFVLATGAVTGLRADTLPFDAPGWKLGQGTSQVEYKGRSALRVESGAGVHESSRFDNGTIEFDVALSGERAFVYLLFRMQDDANHEELYLRSHKSNQPDALQYSPVIRGVSHWQVFHGPGGTASVTLPSEEWIHVTVVVRDQRAAVWVGEVEEPQMVIARLAWGDSGPGPVALRGFLPRGTPTEWSAYFANLEVRPDVFERQIPAADAPSAAPGTVREWVISEPWSIEDDEATAAPPASLERFQKVGTEPDGTLLFLRHMDRPEGASGWATQARLTVRAETAGPRRIDLGWSDILRVFHDGRLLMRADHSYSNDLPRRQGVVGLHQGSVWLDLAAGENVLDFEVTDFFGGWALIARFPDADGISWSAGGEDR